MRKYRRGTPEYAQCLTTYLKTKEGAAFALDILSQLIESFTVDHKSRIKDVTIDDEKPIKLHFE